MKRVRMAVAVLATALFPFGCGAGGEQAGAGDASADRGVAYDGGPQTLPDVIGECPPGSWCEGDRVASRAAWGCDKLVQYVHCDRGCFDGRCVGESFPAPTTCDEARLRQSYIGCDF